MKIHVPRAGAFRFRSSILLPVVIAFLPGQLSAAPVFPNGGFENGLTGWSVTGNAAIKQAAPYTAAEGTRLVAFNSGNTIPDGVVSRSFATVPGSIYRLDFAAGVLAYHPTVQRLGVTVAGGASLLSETVSLNGSSGGRAVWRDSVYYFIADSSSATLVFRDLSEATNGVDLLLDDVEVERTTVKPLVNGSLEDGAWGWTLIGNVRAIPVPGYQPRDGSTVASFNTGNTVPNGALGQTVATVPGRGYLLRYHVGVLSYRRGWQKMETRITGLAPGSRRFSEQGAGKGTVEWYSRAFAFTASGPLTSIEFVDTSEETLSIDLLIDKVSLEEIPAGFVLLNPDTFVMGSPPDEYGHAFNETQHIVSFRNSQLAKTTEVTWTEWNDVRVMAQAYGYNDIGAGRNGENGSIDGSHPVTEVSWWDAVKWCNLRSEQEGLRPVYHTAPGLGAANVLRNGSPEVYPDWNSEGYRLPTEAEWESLCRAGTRTAYHSGGNLPFATEVDPALGLGGWYAANSGGNTHTVGTKMANPWGIHDTHGNVWEWCWDRFDDTDYSPLPAIDPSGPAVGLGPDRMIRGGSYHMSPYWLRSAQRGWHDPFARYSYLGFRPVRTIIR